ncbi:TetR/AcrR family transcriptional regulator [Streptomyces olindensis]|uniref:TetR/AcrR family transcriptional regulator n=1 Tax=Streptomyces olindensis TaxID=358823 RepID=UPI0033CB6925
MVKRSRPTLTERRAEELHMTIARKAAEIFVADGDTSATVERIADAVGMSTRTFYRHFPVKEDVVRPLFRHSSQQVVEALRNAPRDGDLVETLVTAWTAELDSGPNLSPFGRTFLALVAASPQYRLRWMEVDDELCQAMAGFLRERIGEGDSPLASVLPGFLIVQATRHVFMHWITSETGEDIADLLREAFRMVLDGVRTTCPAHSSSG